MHDLGELVSMVWAGLAAIGTMIGAIVLATWRISRLVKSLEDVQDLSVKVRSLTASHETLTHEVGDLDREHTQTRDLVTATTARLSDLSDRIRKHSDREFIAMRAQPNQPEYAPVARHRERDSRDDSGRYALVAPSPPPASPARFPLVPPPQPDDRDDDDPDESDG